MAPVTVFDPAITIPLNNGWNLVALQASRVKGGIEATLQLFNGAAKSNQEAVKLFNDEHRESFAELVAAMTKTPLFQAREKLKDLSTDIEGRLREHARASSKKPSPAAPAAGLLGPYSATDKGLVWIKNSKDGAIEIPLTAQQRPARSAHWRGWGARCPRRGSGPSA